METHRSAASRHKGGLFRHARRAADMERPHGQLRPRLADGLRRDNADRFAHIDEPPRRKVTAVAERACAAFRLAGQHGTNLDFIQPRVFNAFR